eukprot:67797_1
MSVKQLQLQLQNDDNNVNGTTNDDHKVHKSFEERKNVSLLLTNGYIREVAMKNNIDQYIIPSSIINLFFQYYFDIFEAKWSNKYKGNGMILSENDTKVTSTTDHKGCRGRDPITRGMIVEWTANCFVINGICLGVISSNTTDFNCCAAGNLQDVYGIDDCPSMYYYGNNKRHVAIESDSDNDSDNDN